jgi:MFS family permease
VTTTRLLTWSAYLLMACQGYLIYAVGFITPYLRQDLGVPPWMAALPNSALAVGITVGGAASAALGARVGGRMVIRAWALVMGGSAVLLALPVTILPILLGALFFGMSVGGTIVHVNSSLGTGARGSTMLMRANVWSMAGGLVGPLVLSAAAASIGWWLGPLVPVPLLVALAFVLPASPARDRPNAEADAPGLPVAYWLSWTYLTLSIAVEFSFVAWGAQMVSARTGIDVVAATGLASLFVAGMGVGRLALSAGQRSAVRQVTILRGLTILALAGAAVTWLAPRPELAGLGLFLGGLGISGTYPLAATLALAHAPRSPVRASARLTAASGVAIFFAPLAVGVVVGIAGIADAWLIVPATIVTALVILLRVPVPATRVDRADLIEG